jgi:uncharacterized protein YbbC (DUF1343 family)
VQIHPTDPKTFRPVATYVALVALARAQAPDRFAFRQEPYELRDDVPAYDLLTGDAEARMRTLAGDDARDIAESISRTTEREEALVTNALESSMRHAI